MTVPVSVLREYRRQHLAIRDRAQYLVARAWSDRGGLTVADSSAFRAVAVAISQAARSRQIDLMEAYVSHTRSLGFRRPAVPVKLDSTVLLANYRGGVDPMDVYERPIVAGRTAIAGGKTFTEAMQAGLVRAQGLVDADVLMMQRDAMSAAIVTEDGVPAGQRIIGYQRVLGDGGVSGICGLCITASTQLYRSGDLEPIHLNCTCGVCEVYSDVANAAHASNRSVLAQIQTLARDEYNASKVTGSDGAQHAADLKGTRFSIDEHGDLTRVDKQPLAVEVHGELGPVMVDAEHSFTSQADLQAA